MKIIQLKIAFPEGNSEEHIMNIFILTKKKHITFKQYRSHTKKKMHVIVVSFITELLPDL